MGAANEKDLKEDSVSSLPTSSIPPEVIFTREKSTVVGDFAPSLNSRDSEISNESSIEKKSLPTFKSLGKGSTKRVTFNSDTQTDRKGLRMTSETKPSFSSSIATTSGIANSRRAGPEPLKTLIFSSSLDTNAETARGGRGHLDENPTSIARFRLDPANKFSLSFGKQPAKPYSAQESNKFNYFALEKEVQNVGSGGFRGGDLDEKSPSQKLAGRFDLSEKSGKPALDTWLPSSDEKPPSQKLAGLFDLSEKSGKPTWDTWSPSSDGKPPSQKLAGRFELSEKSRKPALDIWSPSSTSQRSIGTDWYSIDAEDEERLLKWDQAVQEVDMQQSEVLNVQSKLNREQVHAITDDTIQMRLDITDLYQRLDERTEATEVLKVVLSEMEQRMVEEVGILQLSTTKLLEAERAELSAKVIAEEKIRQFEFGKLEEEVQRLKQIISEDIGKHLLDMDKYIDELTLKIDEDEQSSPGNTFSQQSLEEKLMKLQKSLADAASKSELWDLKKDLQREAKQRTKDFQALEGQFLTRAEFKPLKADVEREGKILAKSNSRSRLDSELKDKLSFRSAELVVGKDILSKLRAEFDDKIAQVQSNLKQMREEVSSISAGPDVETHLNWEQKARIADAFQFYDTSNSGQLSGQYLRLLLKDMGPHLECEPILNKYHGRSLNLQQLEEEISLQHIKVMRERRDPVDPMLEALDNETSRSPKKSKALEIKARTALQEEMDKIVNNLREELERGIQANREEIDIIWSDLRKMPTEMLAQQINGLAAELEIETANRKSQDEKHDEELRNLADSLSRRQLEHGIEIQRGLEATKDGFEKEHRSHTENAKRFAELINSKLDEERDKRKQAISKVEEHLASHMSQIVDNHASHIEKYEDTMKRLTEHSKHIEMVKRSHQDDLDNMRKRHDAFHKDFEKELIATRNSQERETAKVAGSVKQLSEKLDCFSKDQKNLIGEIHDRLKNESKDRSKEGVEFTRKLEQVARAREDEVKRQQKVDEEMKKQMEKAQQETKKAIELHINQNDKKWEGLDNKLASEIKRSADERATSMRDVKDIVKNAHTEQHEKLERLSKDVASKVLGFQQDAFSKLTALSREVDTKVEKANGQQTKNIMGVSQDLRAQLQDMISQERRACEKGLKEVRDRLDVELRRRSPDAN